MRVVLAASGTRGDVQPMLALAVALKKRRHAATVVGPPNLANEAAQFGVDYRPFGRDTEKLLADNRRHLGANPLPMLRVLRGIVVEDLSAQFDALKDAAKGADLVLAGGMMFAAASVADAMKIPFRYVAYTPDAIPSAFHAPMSSPQRTWPRWFNRAAWWAFGRVGDWLMKKTVNARRAELGLPPLKETLNHFFPRDRVLLAADPALVGWPPDLARATPPTGAWILPDKRELGAELEAFLGAGEPPVYFGFGSMVDEDPERTTRTIAEAVRHVGCRAIISSGWAKLGGAYLGRDIHVIGAVPHATLFTHVGAVVHHGGAGTCHAAARAGVPQIVVPHLLDQFGWAHRIHERGLSPPPFPRSALRADRLAASLHACLTDVRMQRRTALMRNAVLTHDGVSNAIALLERLADGARPSSRVPPSTRRRRANAVAA
jgi:vancomycin aglycone glucosyltransferase